jgi:hypothetical protein
MAVEHGGPPPDDPRLKQIAEAIDRVRGWTFPFVVWSSPLPHGRDVHEQVETLMREPWGLFSGTALLDEQWPESSGVQRFEELSEEKAVRWLTWILGHDLAYNVELIPAAQANELATEFVDVLPSTRRWFTNGAKIGGGDLSDRGGVTVSNPLTKYTFDSGVIAAGEGRAYIVWFTGED